MKDSTLQTLITARALLEQAERYAALGDRYSSTAGLIILQDAVELFFLAVLIEKGIDETKNVEKLSFDEMVGEIGKLGIRIPKSGTLKAMNKLRVTAKHYGQVMEPLTVRNHVNAAKFAVDFVLQATLNRTVREIFLTEIIGDTTSRPFLDKAVSALDNGQYSLAITNARQAFYIEFEASYSIYDFRRHSANDPQLGLIGGILGILNKAPERTRNGDWIAKNVMKPTDFVQIDYERWRLDAMEWGISTQTLNNIRRLTPPVVQLDKEWFFSVPISYAANNSNRDNAALCLDLTIEVIRKKHEYFRSARLVKEGEPYQTPDAYVGQSLLQRPDSLGPEIHKLEEGDTYIAHEMLTGFDKKIYYKIHCTLTNGTSLAGYVERQIDTPLDEEGENEIQNGAKYI